jgi:peptidyl-prolyl isomerase D
VTEEQKVAYYGQLTPLLLNTALAALKVTPPSPELARESVKSTTRVLEVPGISATDKGKALYRRSLAYTALQEDEEAEKDLVDAGNVVPGDAAVKTELEKVRARKREKREKQKKAYKGLFASS